jgi:TM2 domain-containing membrane protein YozV
MDERTERGVGMTTDSFLLELFKEEHTHARHTETQRLEVTKFLLVGGGVLFGFMGTLKFSIYCLPFGVVIILLGLTGVAITSTYVDRFDDHRGRARALRVAIDGMVSPSGLAKKIYADNQIRKTERVRDFWIKINYGVVILGAICLLCNVLAVAARMQTNSGSHTCTERIMHQLSLN